MLGELTSDQIEHLLHSEVVGRIGCHAAGRTYVVPVNYAYDGEFLYGHAADGMKLQMMRENPELCFEVDRRTWSLRLAERDCLGHVRRGGGPRGHAGDGSAP